MSYIFYIKRRVFSYSWRKFDLLLHPKKMVECDSALRDAPRCVVFTFWMKKKKKSWPRATHTHRHRREREKTLDPIFSSLVKRHTITAAAAAAATAAVALVRRQLPGWPLVNRGHHHQHLFFFFFFFLPLSSLWGVFVGGLIFLGQRFVSCVCVWWWMRVLYIFFSLAAGRQISSLRAVDRSFIIIFW